MIVRWPGKVKAEQLSEQISYFPDFFQTLADIAGIDKDYQTDGISLLPVFLGQQGQQQHDYLYWEFPAYGGQQAIRYGQWKGVRKGLFKDPSAPLELYDLNEDIGETRNVAAEHPELVQALDSMLKVSRVPSALFPFEALDNY
jgi:arylsulfatase